MIGGEEDELAVVDPASRAGERADPLDERVLLLRPRLVAGQRIQVAEGGEDLGLGSGVRGRLEQPDRLGPPALGLADVGEGRLGRHVPVECVERVLERRGRVRQVAERAMDLPQLVAVEGGAGRILGRVDGRHRAIRAIEGRARVPAQEGEMRQPAPDRRRRSGVEELRVGVGRGRDVAELEARVADHCERVELGGVGGEGRLRLREGAAKS